MQETQHQQEPFSSGDDKKETFHEMREESKGRGRKEKRNVMQSKYICQRKSEIRSWGKKRKGFLVIDIPTRGGGKERAKDGKKITREKKMRERNEGEGSKGREVHSREEISLKKTQLVLNTFLFLFSGFLFAPSSFFSSSSSPCIDCMSFLINNREMQEERTS